MVANKDGGYPSNPSNEARALKHLLKLFIMTPEFHTTNRHTAASDVRATYLFVFVRKRAAAWCGHQGALA